LPAIGVGVLCRRESDVDPQGAIGVTLVLDAGALVTLERKEQLMWVRVEAAEIARELPLTHGGVGTSNHGSARILAYLAVLDYSLMSYRTTTAQVVEALSGA
jgi:hypothetical protein